MTSFASNIDLAEKGEYDFVERDLADVKMKGNLPMLGKLGSTGSISLTIGKAYPDRDETSVGAIKLVQNPAGDQFKSIKTTTGLTKDSTTDIIAGSSGTTKSYRNEKGIVDLLNNRDPNAISRDFETYPQGFPRLAAFQNSSSDLAIFRRFGTAHCRVLMHLQCEITGIIKDLDDLDISDSDSDKGMLYRLRRNEWHEGWDTAQKDLLEKLQRRLVIYDDILLKDRGLRALESPEPHHYQGLFNWILGYKPLDGGQYDFLFHRDDFVASKPNNHYSRFDRIIEKCLNRWPRSKFFQFLEKSRKVDETSDFGVYTFSRTKAIIAAKLLALIVAFIIILMPVLLLYLIQMSDGARAAMVLVFVLAFGILMSLFVGAKVETVFVGTCTYCAVLVTFLGNVQVSASL